ncbi:unnamed protein product [Colias eurytheme]|nr:unnamed protein product [Colias eurytheme]
MLCIVFGIDCALSGRYVTWLPSARLQCWMLLTVYTNDIVGLEAYRPQLNEDIKCEPSSWLVSDSRRFIILLYWVVFQSFEGFMCCF